jgi:Tfp pilus assembly protein PilN
MIKINLATRKQSSMATSDSRSGSGAFGYGSFIPRGDVNIDSLKALPIKNIVIYILLGVAVDFVVGTDKEDRLNAVNAQIAKVTAKKTEVEQELAKSRGYEEAKKNLEADELTLRTKIDVIKKLLEDRSASPKMMITLSAAIPDDVWLKSMKIDEERATFKGASLGGVNPISDFLRALSESAYFMDPQVSTAKEKDELAGDVDGFEVIARRR